MFFQDFEKKIFKKTNKRDDEILLLDGFTVSYKSNVDLLFYVFGSQDENELLLAKLVIILYSRSFRLEVNP